MDQVQLCNTFAETPKDGHWYKIPGIVTDLSEYIQWDNGQSHWNWIMLKDDVVVVDASFILESGSW